MKYGALVERVPLWAQLAIFATVGVVVTHAVHLAVGNRIASRALSRQQEELGAGIARLAAKEATDSILVHDVVSLSEIVSRTAQVRGVSYCFVLKGGEILASSFAHGTPLSLVELRAAGHHGPIVVVDEHRRYLDLEESILGGGAGIVRLGVDMSRLESTRRETAVPLGVLAVAVIVAGVAAALMVGRRVAKPIDELVVAADRFDPAGPFAPVDPRGGPEVARLGDRFNRMMKRLRAAHAEQERARQTAVTRERMAVLGSLVAGVAHEVNNPLAGLKNCVHALKQGDLEPNTRDEYVDLMQQGLDRIGDVVRRLLEFARPQPLSLAWVRATDLASEAARLVGASLRRRRVSLEESAEPGSQDAMFLADKQQMEQALLNLLLNAAYVTPDGGLLRLHVRRRAGALGIAVRDQGPGIPPEIRDRVLDPFFTTKPEGEGTGLGLSVTHTIVGAHGGKLEFEFPADGGTVATIWLGEARVAQPDAPEEASRPLGAP